MIEKEFVQQNKKAYKIKKITEEDIRTIVGHSDTKLVKTPLGEKIIIYTSKPGLLVGKKGENTQNIIQFLKRKMDLDNPEIEVREVAVPDLDAKIVADKIKSGLERFGVKRMRWIIHRALDDIMNQKAMGAEIRLTGKVQGARSKSLRVFSGYLKKCGNTADNEVKKAESTAKLKQGVVGIKVSIMPQGTKLGDKVTEITPETLIEEEKKKTETKQVPTKKKELKKIRKKGMILKENEEPKEKKEKKPRKTAVKKTTAKPKAETPKVEEKKEEAPKEDVPKETETKVEEKKEEKVESNE